MGFFLTLEANFRSYSLVFSPELAWGQPILNFSSNSKLGDAPHSDFYHY